VSEDEQTRENDQTIAHSLADFVSGVGAEELARRLLLICDPSQKTVALWADPSVEAQLTGLYEQSPTETKHVFREAVVLALNGWSIRSGSLETLQHLAFLASNIRAPGLIAPLQRILDSPEFRNARTPEHDWTRSRLFGVIGAVASQESFEVLRAYFFDDNVPLSLTGQLFMGIVAAMPNQYHEYVPRFFDLVDHSDEPFNLRTVARGLVHYVKDHPLVDRLGLLPMPDFERLLEALAIPPEPIRDDQAPGQPYFTITCDNDMEVRTPGGTSIALQMDDERLSIVSRVWTRQQRATRKQELLLV
jgi:hypothetical protein